MLLSATCRIRLANRVQISSDALAAYVGAIERGFGRDVDYGQIVKFYEAEPVGAGRYSPPKVVGTERTPVIGRPDPAHISTSFIERQNLTMRMSMRRFTTTDERFFKKEGRKSASSGCVALRALQFRPRSSDVAMHSGDGGRVVESHLGDGRIDGRGFASIEPLARVSVG